MSETTDPLKLFFAEFVASAQRSLDELERALRVARNEPSEELMSTIVRSFHSLKGNSAFFEGNAITPLARAAEAAARFADGCDRNQREVLFGALEDSANKLRYLVVESAELGEPPPAPPVPDPLIAVLESVGVDGAGRSYRFAGADVTEEVQLLSAVADGSPGPSVDRQRMATAIDTLSRLARAAEAHDVARSIEAVELPEAASGGPPAGCELDPAAVREALRSLAPLLERTDGS